MARFSLFCLVVFASLVLVKGGEDPIMPEMPEEQDHINYDQMHPENERPEYNPNNEQHESEEEGSQEEEDSQEGSDGGSHHGDSEAMDRYEKLSPELQREVSKWFCPRIVHNDTSITESDHTCELSYGLMSIAIHSHLQVDKCIAWNKVVETDNVPLIKLLYRQNENPKVAAFCPGYTTTSSTTTTTSTTSARKTTKKSENSGTYRDKLDGTGPIVGIVAGVLFLIVMIILFIVARNKRNENNKDKKDGDMMTNPMLDIDYAGAV
eukprot:m.343788 g.343788  ORF g.343788 m.343788 type:complete len:265 (+) comp23300_c0_seq1:236-1030(+)